jgi:hypothetical protein
MVDVCVTLPRVDERANPRSTVATLEAKTVLGEVDLLLGLPSTASIIARSTVCSQITRGSFYAAIDLGDVWAARLALAVASTLARLSSVHVPKSPLGSSSSRRELVQLRTRYWRSGPSN